MRLFRIMLSCILLIMCSTHMFAQQQYANTLLWRISGKGLEKPSYLFGTMHLTDKRLFRFDDSVYSAIEKSEGLAIELNPDEMAAYSVNHMFDELDEKSKKLKDVLSAEDYKKYSAKLAVKFKKKADEITVNDIVKEKNKWMTEYLAKGEMPTFLDAYLYNTGKKLGKWTGGIEDMVDQEGELGDRVDKRDIEYILAADNAMGEQLAVETMIRLYCEQDIKGILAFGGSASGIIKRNIKMARRMDSLSALRTMFFAVGAAHLAGDSGVINILRSRGFTVEPVTSQKKIDADDYIVKEIEQPWYNVSDANNLYKVSMPGNPASVKLYGVTEIKFLMDILNSAGFSTMVIPGGIEESKKDNLFDTMAANIFKKPKLVWKKVETDNVEGREYLEELDGTYCRLQLFCYDKKIYMLNMYALKKEFVMSSKADKFFTSFTISKDQASTDNKMYEFADSILGIRFEAPAKMEYNEKMSKSPDDGNKVAVYAGLNVASGSYIMLITTETKPGYHIVSDKIVYDNFSKKFSTQYSGIQESSSIKQGHKILEITGKNIEQSGLYIRAMNLIDGNRSITLLALTDSANKELGKNVLNSFEFFPHSNLNWVSSVSSDSVYTTWTPSSFRHFDFVTNHRSQFGYDTTTATSYFVIPNILTKYTWFENDSSFWHTQIHGFTSYKDSIISITTVANGPVVGREYLVKKDSSDTYNRIRLLVNDTILYKLYVSSEKGLLYDDNTNKFFNDFRFNSPVINTFATDSKALKILSEIASKDSVTRCDAYYALKSAPFSEKDLPLLHETLFKQYLPINEYDDTTVINQAIAKQLANIKDTSVIALIKQKYSEFINEKRPLKIVALALLAKLHTKESYDLLAHLLITSPPEKDALSYKIRAGLNDSLALTASIYSSLAKLASDSTYGPSLAKISLTLIDSSALDKSVAKAYEGDFITAANTLLPALKKKTDDFYNYEIRDLIKLLLVLNSPASVKTVKDYLQVHDKDLREYVAARLLEKGIPVQPEIITGIAADKVSRQNLYYDLKKMNRSSLFPKQYLTQAYFAESQMYLMASDEDYPTSITFLLKKEGLYSGKKYLFYLYKVTYGKGKDATSYLGVAGGYNLSGTGIEEKEELTQVFTDEEFDANKIAQLFNKYLKSLAKSDDETED